MSFDSEAAGGAPMSRRHQLHDVVT